MKAPSKNISKSLNSQNPVARGEETPSVSGMKGPAKGSMTIPGDGGVCDSPGIGHLRDAGRSARRFTEPMSRYGGKGN